MYLYVYGNMKVDNEIISNSHHVFEVLLKPHINIEYVLFSNSELCRNCVGLENIVL